MALTPAAGAHPSVGRRAGVHGALARGAGAGPGAGRGPGRVAVASTPGRGPSPSTAPGIVVLGMHRSGTSAVCRILNLLGADLGPGDDLLRDYDNPAGHWESRALVACNDRILAGYGRSWDFPPRLAPGWEHGGRATAMLPDLSATFASVYGERPWVWKDPRTCLTFPLWRRVLGGRVVVVLVQRDPAAVVASLRRRDGIPPLYGVGLWHRYVRAAVIGAAGLPVLNLPFERLVADPPAVVERLAADLGDLGVALEGNTASAATSVHLDLVHDPQQRTAPGRLTATVEAALAALPARSEAFVAPRWREPRWVRPFLYAYRGTWMVRARSGHPLRTGYA